MNESMPIVLASRSRYRAKLLENAGLGVRCEGAEIDERVVEQPLVEAGSTPDDVATVLAQAKAIDVSQRNHDALVIGADQVLSLKGEILHKVDDMDGARRRLLLLQGQRHILHSAVAFALAGKIIWQGMQQAFMTMRPLTPQAVGRHLALAGPDVINSVGCYHYEGVGIQLFDKVKGDYFSIVGLPLLDVLKGLRLQGVIDE